MTLLFFSDGLYKDLLHMSIENKLIVYILSIVTMTLVLGVAIGLVICK